MHGSYGEGRYESQFELTEMKNMLNRIKSKLDMAEKTLSELKGIAIKTVQKIEKEKKKKEQSISEL